MRRLLGACVRLFPRAFRARFAAELTAQIERDLERARARGAFAACWFALATTTDLLRSAVAERSNPTWATPRRARPKERGMRQIMNGYGDTLNDLKLAVRALRRTPGFAAVSALTLGLAIGVTTGMFSVVDSVLLRPLPYAEVDRLVHIGATAPGSDMPAEFGVSSEFYLQYKELSHLLEDISIHDSFTNTFRTPDRVERIRMSSPTPTLFSTLGVKPILGRLPTAADGGRVVVISDALWISWFGRDPAVVGRAYEIDGVSRTVIAVLPPEFQFPRDGTLLWLPDEIRAEGLQPGRFRPPLVARVKAGVTPEQLAAELTELARRLPERFGGTPNYHRLMTQHRAVVRPLEEELLGEVSQPLWVLLAATLVVLLIACANVANLFLVRAEGRQRELAVRRAIGAARGQLVRLQMAEALVVAALAGVLAVASRRDPAGDRACRADRHSAPRSGRPRPGDAPLHARRRAGFGAGVRLVPALRARPPTSPGCARADAARPTAGAGLGSPWSRARPRSRSCCSSVRDCSCAASRSSARSILDTRPRTCSASSSRPSSRRSRTAPPGRASTSTSSTGSRAPGRLVGRPGGEPAAGRGHRERAVLADGHAVAGDGGTLVNSISPSATTLRPWGSGPRRADTSHDHDQLTDPRQRRDQPVGGEAALA